MVSRRTLGAAALLLVALHPGAGGHNGDARCRRVQAPAASSGQRRRLAWVLALRLTAAAPHPAARMLRQSDPPAVTPTGLELSAAINTFGSALFDALAAEVRAAWGQCGVGQAARWSRRRPLLHSPHAPASPTAAPLPRRTTPPRAWARSCPPSLWPLRWPCC